MGYPDTRCGQHNSFHLGLRVVREGSLLNIENWLEFIFLTLQLTISRTFWIPGKTGNLGIYNFSREIPRFFRVCSKLLVFDRFLKD